MMNIHLWIIEGIMFLHLLGQAIRDLVLESPIHVWWQLFLDIEYNNLPWIIIQAMGLSHPGLLESPIEKKGRKVAKSRWFRDY